MTLHENLGPTVRRLCHAASLALVLLAPPALVADPIPVKLTQGAAHGFLVVRSNEGVIIGNGEYTQVLHDDRLTAHMTLHLPGGSLDDDLTVFNQHGDYTLISDHHIQRGPFFAEAIDSTLLANGSVTIKTVGKDGKAKIETTHMDLPRDVSNGYVGVLLMNVPANVPDFKLNMFSPSGKGRLVGLQISRDRPSSFSIAGVPHRVNVFRLSPHLGGIAGVVAPLVGMQPADVLVYILEGDSPTFVREVGQISEGGPIISIELAGAKFAPVNATGSDAHRARN